ncbi:GNAT family N-acetyltransferase [Bacteroides intestinalis]|uniref:GNAT family N-acetyltransferase n=1 Tax=Bacteroides intestinalis TaxID=329854 RepID=UPI0006983FD9|nr:GNAT family N-acetyltransferase [Bacteroides intestinalis]
MVYDKIIEGKFVRLRPVMVEDAEFILCLRNDKDISKYLPPLNVTVKQQQGWINKQRNDTDSYYFIFEKKNGTPIGTISVYNIQETHAEAGRYCSIGDSVCNIEAALLIDDFIFDILNLDYIDSWVYKDNKQVVMQNQGFGCKWDGEAVDEHGEPYLYGKLHKEEFKRKSAKIRKNISIIKSV